MRTRSRQLERSKRQGDASLTRFVSLTQTDVHHEQAAAAAAAVASELATCSLLCSHTRARINLSVSCHVQRSHSLSPAAHRLQSLSRSREERRGEERRERGRSATVCHSSPLSPPSRRREHGRKSQDATDEQTKLYQ